MCFTDSKCATTPFSCRLGHRSCTLTQTVVGPDGLSTTTLFRALRKNKEERVARLEWAPNGGLGRAQIGKVGRHVPQHHIGALTYIYATQNTVSMGDLVQHDSRVHVSTFISLFRHQH